MEIDDVVRRLSKLEEVEKIKELRAYRFPKAGDPEMDVDAAVALFTDDGVAEYTGGIGCARGSEELRAFFESDPVNGRFHLFVPAWIRVDDNLTTGSGLWHVLETAKAPSARTGTNEPVWIQAVIHDDYRKVDDEWRIAKYSCDIRMFCSYADGWGTESISTADFFSVKN